MLIKERQKVNIRRFNDDKILTTIAQHNELVFARYAMTYLETRIFVCLLSQINKDDRAFKAYRIPIQLLNTQARGGDYTNIIEAANRLLSKTIQFYNKDTKKWTGRTLMAECSYQEGEGFVSAKFNELMRPYLLELQGNYTLTSLKHLNTLKSANSFRLYYILRTRLFNTPGGTSVRDSDGYDLDLGFFKYILELDGQYKRFYDLKKRVLDVAKRELSKTDLTFNYKPVKKGRSVVAIRFFITSEPEPIQLDIFPKDKVVNHEPENEYTSRALKILSEWGFSKKQVSYIMRGDHQQICKISYELKTLKSKPENKVGWAYSEFTKRLGLGN